jgi:uncharacterized membrane protein
MRLGFERALRWISVVTLLPLGGCATADSDLPEADVCADQPVVTYENFGQGFMTQHCQSCHASALVGDARSGAPASVSFDTAADVGRFASAILDVSVENDAMPPGGGVADDDRARLEIWLRCFAPTP